MDLSALENEMKYVNKLGLTLNMEEKLKIEISIKEITEKFQFDQVLFWGKIKGIEKDYYIIMGLQIRGNHNFPNKVYFWANNQFKFGQMPDNTENKHQLKNINTPFSGQHEQIILRGGENQNELGLKMVQKNITELDRLSYTVRTIENDCAVVPIGAFKLTPTSEIRYNETFKGLSIDQLSNIASYQHFRAPQTQEKQEMILRNDALYQPDFLDALSSDVPKDCWSIQQDYNKTDATVRSLLWPGYIAYHRANSKIFGRCYIGYGIQSQDLPFII